MIPLTALAHQHVRRVLQPGELAIDATAGNGHDTCFLAECVGPAGFVLAFEIQDEAIRALRQEIQARRLRQVSLLQQGHQHLAQSVPTTWYGRVAAIMFNLGYLPGGDLSLTTQTATTIMGISQGLPLLKNSGVMTVLAYPGHCGGEEETQAVRSFLRANLPTGWTLQETTGPPGRAASPVLFTVQASRGEQS